MVLALLPHSKGMVYSMLLVNNALAVAGSNAQNSQRVSKARWE